MSLLASLRNVGVYYRAQKNVFHHTKRQIWALHDVSFDLHEGEKLGVIGRNGCGKSTLMKLLAGVFDPDRGSLTYSRPVHVQLLSLGVGFEGSLSGADNAVLNGMLMGKSRKHMLSRLESIREFSDLGQFFDLPVSTYSSGMNVRLGFSVAMETEPEVLLIDEVLGVGDASFMAKSNEALRSKFANNCTVVLVSHDAPTVRRLCDRAVWIERGRTIMEGPVDQVIDAYMKDIESPNPGASHELRPD